MCSSCFAIPTITIQLLITSLALLYGQRTLFPKDSSHKWTKRITLGVTILVSLVLSALGIFLLVLSSNEELRARNFVNICARQNLKDNIPLDEHRCSILMDDEGGGGSVKGKVLEFGPGPGTNFKCFQNSTSNLNIEKYVAVEPNSYFEEEMNKEKAARGLNFPLQFIGLKGEDIDISPQEEGSFDVVIMTHVLCSVDSVENVLSNAERALKSGGTILFMEHVIAKRSTVTWYVQGVFEPIFNILGNGCRVRDLKEDISRYLDERFDITVEEFEAPLPVFMQFAKPHIKGVAIKK